MLNQARPFVAYKEATHTTPEVKAQGWNEDCLIFCTNNLPKDQSSEKYLRYLKCLRYAIAGGCPRPEYICKTNFMGCIGQLCEKCPPWRNKVVETLPDLEWLDAQRDVRKQWGSDVVSYMYTFGSHMSLWCNGNTLGGCLEMHAGSIPASGHNESGHQHGNNYFSC